jgi:hypothetical protein
MRILLKIGIGILAWWALYFLVRLLPIKPSTRDRLLRVLALVLIVLIAGPEVGLEAEAVATLNAIGADLFLASLIIGLHMVPIRYVLDRLKKFVERLDPYFFIPSSRQVRDCPPIIWHALPFCILMCLALALWGVAKVDV